MHFRTRTWFMISVLCFLGALIFWQLGERKAARDRSARERAAGLTNSTPAGPGGGGGPGTGAAPTNAAAAAPTNTAAVQKTNAFPYRLSNTTKTVNELIRSDNALLLYNAHIDSSARVDLPIPAHLR